MTPERVLESISRPPRQQHGMAVRVVMGVLGLLVALGTGAPAVVIVWGWPRSPGALLAALMLALVAVYGGSLAWRGARGYSRTSRRQQRLMMVILSFITLLGALGSVGFVAKVVRMDPVAMLRAPLISEDALNWRIAMMTLALPLQLVAHELGHLLAGHAVGFAFRGIQFGPFHLGREDGRWRICWRPMLLGFAGRAEVVVRDEHRLAERMAFFAAGGPLANFLLAALSAGAVAALGTPGGRAGAFVAGVLLGCALEGVVFGVLNLIPVGEGSTDGSRILQALGRRSKGPTRHVQR